MNWDSVGTTFGTTTIIFAALGFIAKNLVELYFRVLDEKSKANRALRTASAERVREEVVRWAGPVSRSVEGLQKRLRNILFGYAYPALALDRQLPRGWSIRYDYFLPSTTYYFCQYFCWIRLFEEELNFELFKKEESKDRFFKLVHGAAHKLSGYPLKELNDTPGKIDDKQIFTLEQRLLGEILVIAKDGETRCMSYAEFLDRWDDPQFKKRLGPIVEFLDGLNPDHECRWRRLLLLSEALAELEAECRKLLSV